VPPDDAQWEPSVEIGYTAVDAQPETIRLIEGMEATARWPAVIQLREWERERLALRPGQSIIDVGCGIGEVALALSRDVAPGGHVVGIDASEAMLTVARERAAGSDVDMTFRTGDAAALDEPDASFDACRSERMLQWLMEPETAIDEMIRVVRPGGRISLIDTDWRTFAADVDDHDHLAVVMEAMRGLRGTPAAVGGLLRNLALDAGLVDVEHTAATHVWTEWDPDLEPGPAGLFPLAIMFGQLADLGRVEEGTARSLADDLMDRARRGRLFISLTMFAVVGTRPN
jgi:SAM-dependent methyltransferase